MTRLTWFHVYWLVPLLSGGWAGAGQAMPDRVPKTLQVPPSEQLLFKTIAQGSQIYVCRAKATEPQQFEWTLKAPDAVLRNEQGKIVGKHSAGPQWAFVDGSKVTAEIKQRENSPDANAIPWLLLQVKSHAGTGDLNSVNWIQRLQTKGGKAPASGCDRSRQTTEVKVSYTADYYFYGKPAGNTNDSQGYY